MTQKTLSGMLLIVIVMMISFKAQASGSKAKASSEISLTQGLTEEPLKGSDRAHSLPYFPARESKESHSKASTPQMDEVAHIHKFHKERVKKMKKHHSKYWFLSKLILVLCHLSILVIAYLHITH